MEIWKDIEGFEGLYQVSSYGRVRSFDRYDRMGRVKRGTILAPCDNSRGYKYVCLCKDGSKKHEYIHRLVAMHFLINDRNCSQINHKDENKSNNNLSNLEWCTPSENINYGNAIHKIKTNRNHASIGVKFRKKVSQFDRCGLLIALWPSITAAAKALGCSDSAIVIACKNKRRTALGYVWRYAQ
jgi:hypothetical protein